MNSAGVRVEGKAKNQQMREQLAGVEGRRLYRRLPAIIETRLRHTKILAPAPPPRTPVA
jgi:hypothetical protein